MPARPPEWFLFETLGWTSILLLVILLFLLLRGPFRQYPLILAYCAIQLILTGGEDFVRNGHFSTKIYAILYWTDELVLNLLLFLMVITSTYRALGDSPMRAGMGKVLAGLVVVVILVPLLIFKGPFTSSPWLNHTSQLWSFCGAILNLGLWSALVANRKRDPQLLSVSAGLGIAVTGAAISYGVRGYFSTKTIWVPDAFMSATFVVCMLFWCWTFRPKRQTPAQTAAL